MKALQIDFTKQINNMPAACTCAADAHVDFSTLSELPPKTMEEFDEFDCKVSSDSNIRHSLVRCCSFSKNVSIFSKFIVLKQFVL